MWEARPRMPYVHVHVHEARSEQGSWSVEPRRGRGICTRPANGRPSWCLPSLPPCSLVAGRRREEHQKSLDQLSCQIPRFCSRRVSSTSSRDVWIISDVGAVQIRVEAKQPQLHESLRRRSGQAQALCSRLTLEDFPSDGPGRDPMVLRIASPGEDDRDRIRAPRMLPSPAGARRQGIRSIEASLARASESRERSSAATGLRLKAI